MLRCLGMILWYSLWEYTLTEALQRVEEEAREGRLTLPTHSVPWELLHVGIDRKKPAEKLLDAAVESSPWHNDYHIA